MPSKIQYKRIYYGFNVRAKIKIMDQNAEKLRERLRHIRTQTRRVANEYRTLKESDKSGEIHFFYLNAEGIMMRRHLESMYDLYRKTARDLYASK